MCFHSWIGLTNWRNPQIEQARRGGTNQDNLVFKGARLKALRQDISRRNVTKRAPAGAAIATKGHQCGDSIIHRNGKNFAPLFEQNAFESLVVAGQEFFRRKTGLDLG
jgi:hypothetical protein